jgi:hypothetical protein
MSAKDGASFGQLELSFARVDEFSTISSASIMTCADAPASSRRRRNPFYFAAEPDSVCGRP